MTLKIQFEIDDYEVKCVQGTESVMSNLQFDFTKKCCTNYLKVLIVNVSTFRPQN